MGLFSRMFGRGDAQVEKARGLVQIAHIQAFTMFPPLSEQFPILHRVDLEHWDFVVTIAGVFVATSRVEKMLMTEAQKRRVFGAIENGLHQYAPDALRAFEDCKMLFEREFDRLAANGQEPRFIGADALGLWIIWNVLKQQPQNAEEENLIRVVGSMVIHGLFNFWD